jgi:hypothetical protein
MPPPVVKIWSAVRSSSRAHGVANWQLGSKPAGSSFSTPRRSNNSFAAPSPLRRNCGDHSGTTLPLQTNEQRLWSSTRPIRGSIGAQFASGALVSDEVQHHRERSYWDRNMKETKRGEPNGRADTKLSADSSRRRLDSPKSAVGEFGLVDTPLAQLVNSVEQKFGGMSSSTS